MSNELYFKTEAGRLAFLKEGKTLANDERNQLYSQISGYEHVAIHGVQGWAHAIASGFRAPNEWDEHPLYREILIEVKGLEHVLSMEARHHEEERKRSEKRKKWNEEKEKEKRDLHLKFDEFFE
jgi:hypothetical protein